MKKTLLLAALGALIFGCTCNQKKASLDEQIQSLYEEIEAIQNDSLLTSAQIKERTVSLLMKTYDDNMKDSLGLTVFQSLQTCEYFSFEELTKMYNEADTLIKNNARVKKIQGRIDDIIKCGPVKVGEKYIDIEGIDPNTGETNSISKALACGKPVIVDFWASWCPPCRQLIKTELKDLAETKSDQVTIIGIAVWEDSIEDTKKAMTELPITWPIAFTGGRENSPSQKYGVLAIPTVIGINTDGVVVARGHEMKNVLESLGL